MVKENVSSCPFYSIDQIITYEKYPYFSHLIDVVFVASKMVSYVFRIFVLQNKIIWFTSDIS